MSSRKKEIELNVTQEIIDKVVQRHRTECGPQCDHNLVAEAMAEAAKAAGFDDVVVDTGVLPSGRRTVVHIP
jgi:hypothetical protein